MLKKMKKKKTAASTGDKAEGDKKKEVKEAVEGAKKVEKDKMAMPPPTVAKATVA